MDFATTEELLNGGRALPSGVIGVLLCDGSDSADLSAAHLASLGVSAIVSVGASGPLQTVPVPLLRVAEAPGRFGATTALNRVIDAFDGQWLLWLWAGEYFFYPYVETRSIGDFTAFLNDERRHVAFTYALDLYGPELPEVGHDPRAAELYFDRSGYYGFNSEQRELSLYGGLVWRFGELSAFREQQLGRPSLFRARAGIYPGRNGRFAVPDLNSVSCPWHNSPTAAVMTLRHARQIMATEGFALRSENLIWQGSERFTWTSEQLLDLGMIEPGQWF
ncbi:MAG: hypothetical protein AAF334_07975 [Pseudomonadota bacterium]